LFGRLAEEWEWQLAGDRGWETFFRYWTAKEAVLKATGVGLSHLKYARIQRILDADRLIVEYGDRLWPIQQYRFQNHIVSLTNGEEIRWTLSDR
jgi:4'-phosphopantetheinyl transferase